MMSPGRARPKGGYTYQNEEMRLDYDPEIRRRRELAAMDPWKAIKSKQTEDRMTAGTASLLEQYPHLTEAQARQMLGEYPKLWDGGKPRGGGAEAAKRRMLAKHWHAQPQEGGVQQPVTPKLPGPNRPEDRIRDLLPGKVEPFILHCPTKLSAGGYGMPCERVPNPEWGKQNGMRWDGSRWIHDDKESRDMDMEMRRLEMERMRQQIELERQQFEEEMRRMRGETGVAGGLKGWLANRLGGR